jgi:dTDP-4-dehydrorhamnose 3,5-epimerase-like enzyme
MKSHGGFQIVSKRIVVHHDDRGLVFEPLDAEQFPDQRNSHVVISQPGVVRGNHLHKKATEIATVCGPAIARFKIEDVLNEVVVTGDEVVQFVIPPNVAHAFKNDSKAVNLMVAFSSEPHNPDHPDVVKVELFP